MPYKERTIEKKYFSIGEVAFMFKVAPSLIRFWEKEFDILQPKKNRKGNRQFTQQDIENFRLIYHLVKEKGYTLQGAKEMLKEKAVKKEEHRKVDVLQRLKYLKAQLEALRDAL
ncbi:MAG: MerR family transcriptional regulator [Cytophagaceae bacterium]|jgi:DNA-binding transcriptional MerR regulator|nr:MerR family transcriptional regulator [Cytophagaceae bacterium]